MNRKNCPSHENLRGYVLGTVPEDEAESICEHVETCVDCETTMDTLESQPDSYVEGIHFREAGLFGGDPHPRGRLIRVANGSFEGPFPVWYGGPRAVNSGLASKVDSQEHRRYSA